MGLVTSPCQTAVDSILSVHFVLIRIFANIWKYILGGLNRTIQDLELNKEDI